MEDKKHMFWHPNQAHPYLDMDFYRQGRPTAAPERSGIMSQSPLRWLHLCFKRITEKHWWGREGRRQGQDRGGAGEGMRGRHRGGQRGLGAQHTKQASWEHGWSLWHVTGQCWQFQVYHLDYFSGLFFTCVLADGALKSTMKGGGPAVLGLQENQSPGETETWDSLWFYYPSHLLHALLSKCVSRTSWHILWVSTINHLYPSLIFILLKS